MVRRYLENFVQPLELLLWAAAVLALLAKEPLLSVAIVLVVVVNAVFSFLEEFKGGARDHGDKAERAIMETRRSARSWRQGGARDHGGRGSGASPQCRSARSATAAPRAGARPGDEHRRALAVSIGVVFFIVAGLTGMSLTDRFIFAIGVTVSVVPNGMLPTVTLSRRSRRSGWRSATRPRALRGRLLHVSCGGTSHAARACATAARARCTAGVSTPPSRAIWCASSRSASSTCSVLRRLGCARR
jgi:hypothetical protein